MTILRATSMAVIALLTAIAFSTPVSNSQIGSLNHMTQDTKNVIVTRTFDAPVASVWKHWSDSDKVMKWWGPKGFTSPLAKMDFREGGVSLVCMRAPQEFGGFDMYNTWTYKKIVPHERIEFVLNFADKDGNKLDPAKMGLPPGIPLDVPHVITFKALGNSKTEMTVSEYGYTSDQAVETSKAGLEQCLDKMAESLKS
ncbi:MAG TPA: SRPBCC domain-containing protein [Pyrinomonadaceae bacterium]|nr:SRPBCC domain-containing protein [Pyrinomonadaceae bacterium]